jgi:hypothetical protein
MADAPDLKTKFGAFLFFGKWGERWKSGGFVVVLWGVAGKKNICSFWKQCVIMAA